MSRGFSTVHPTVCFLYYLLLFALLMLAFHPVILFIAFISGVWLAALQGQGGSIRGTLRFCLLPSGIVIVVHSVFFNVGSTPLFAIGGKLIMLEAITYGITMSLALIVLFVWFLSYNQTMTAERFLCMAAPLLPQVALVTMISLRFVPLLKERLHQLVLIQKLRGLDVYDGSMVKRAKAGAQLLHALFSWSLQEALETADSMKARGYGVTKRSTYISWSMTRQDWLVLVYMIVTGGGGAWCWLIGGHGQTAYERMIRVGWTIAEWGSIVLLVLFLCIPLVIELKERWQWHCWK